MSSLVNKIYILNNKYYLELREEPFNGSLGENEIAAETLYSCVSPGTELAAYQGLPPLRPGTQYPRVQGYCNIARVMAAGDKVKGIQTGDHVLSFTSHRKYFRCKNEEIISVLHKNADLRKSSTVYLYHLAYMAILESDAKAGMSIGIVGTGTLGYCAATLASVFGFNTTVFTNQEYLCEAFQKKDISYSKKGEASAQPIYGQFDIIINTTSSWDDWFLSMNLLRKKGVMVNLGFPGRGVDLPQMNPLDSRFFYDKQLVLKAAGLVYEGDIDAADIRFNLKRNIRFLLQLIEKNKIDPAEIISKEVNLQELEILYKYLLNRNSRKFTGIINWQDANS